MAFGVVMAAIAWGALLAATPNGFRRRHDAQNTVGWWAVLLLALALTALIPTVQLAIDRAVRLPNASQWLGHALLLTTGYQSDVFLTQLDRGLPAALPAARRQLLARARLIIAITVMAVALVCAHLVATIPLPEIQTAPVNGWVVVFQAAYVLGLSAPLLHVVRSGLRYAHLGTDALIRVGPLCSAMGASAGLGYLLVSVLETLTPAGSFEAANLAIVTRWWGGCALLLLAVGATLPVWGRPLGVALLLDHAHAVSLYWRLRPLWKALVSALPDVMLPVSASWREALVRPAMMHLLVMRRMIEILDAERLALPAWWRTEMDRARYHAGHDTTGSARRTEACRESLLRALARREAAAVESALARLAAQSETYPEVATHRERVAATATEADVADAMHMALDLSRLSATGVIVSYQEQLHYLAHVSQALTRRRWRQRRHRLRRHLPATPSSGAGTTRQGAAST